jgi:hypothetical protein
MNKTCALIVEHWCHVVENLNWCPLIAGYDKENKKSERGIVFRMERADGGKI